MKFQDLKIPVLNRFHGCICNLCTILKYNFKFGFIKNIFGKKSILFSGSPDS